jgi:predicted RNA-binding Zn ribbon-like protein
MPDETRWVFDLCGGHPAIDFANTVSSRHTASPIERLTSYEALVDFAEQSRLLDAQPAARWRAWAQRDPAGAAAVLDRAIELRESLYRLFTAVAAGEAVADADRGTLNQWWHRLELDAAFTWRWAAGDDAPDSLLAPVVTAAVELLTSPRRGRMRICEADDCLWLFLDTSKNNSRRWCDMSQCGNRIKARRFYQRRTERGA